MGGAAMSAGAATLSLRSEAGPSAGTASAGGSGHSRTSGSQALANPPGSGGSGALDSGGAAARTPECCAYANCL